MDISNIKEFLNFNEKPMDKDWILVPLIANIIILCFGVYFSKNKIISGIVCVVFCIVMVFLYFHA